MYTASVENRITFGSEKMLMTAGFLVLTALVFSGGGLTTGAIEAGETLKGRIQENIMLKEQSDDALFLLKKKRETELKNKYAKAQIKIIDEGIAYISFTRYVNSKPVKIRVAEITTELNPDIEILPVTASSGMHARSKVSTMAKKENAILAVNGTYFKQDTGTPLGTLVINKEIISGPVYDRAAIGIFDDGYKTARVSFSGTIKSGKYEIKADNINQPRMSASKVIIYTPKWGNLSPSAKAKQVNISVKNNKILAKSTYPLLIPDDGYVISGPEEKMASFEIGEKAEITYSLSEGWENANHVISGGPYLMKEGEIYNDTASEKLTSVAGKNPRTAVGYTKDNVFIIVTVDGRKEGSSGMTISELAYLMKSLGCYEAVNLDGGSSTSMFENGNLYAGTGLKGSVAVSNALVVRRKTET